MAKGSAPMCCMTPRDAYEWSFVAVPAQINAGVKKTFGGDETPAAPITQDKQLQNEHYDMLTLLKARVGALYELSGSSAVCCKALIDKLSVAELIKLEKTLSAALTKPTKPRTEALREANEKYKTNDFN